MTKEQKMQMFSMRLDGMTQEEIGKKFGVTRQAVCQVLNGSDRKYSKNVAIPGIAKWMDDNFKSAFEMAREMDLPSTTIYSVLQMKHEPNLYIIRKLLKYTGLMFEEAFGVEGV